ncbi:MAG: OsmC family peroxiredoxin [wastewater metagenome]|nr:OsmC family peroxiredoxin [Candidatus Loosdrechtia aerotolerans]
MAEQKTVTEQKVVNGVNVSMIEDTVNAIKDDNEIAKCKFHISNRWIDGGHNQSTIKSFYGAKKENPHDKPFFLDADEPPLLAGGDFGANPVEHLLNALAGCLTTTMVYHAAIRGIKLEEVESELEGDIDLRGFLGLTNEVRNGYQNIRVNFKVKTDAENLERLKALSKLSPVFDVASHGTNIDITMERK